jgi:hypothetical protein
MLLGRSAQVVSLRPLTIQIEFTRFFHHVQAAVRHTFQQGRNIISP